MTGAAIDLDCRVINVRLCAGPVERSPTVVITAYCDLEIVGVLTVYNCGISEARGRTVLCAPVRKKGWRQSRPLQFEPRLKKRINRVAKAAIAEARKGQEAQA